MIKGIIVKNCTVNTVLKFLSKFEKDSIIKGTFDENYNVLLSINDGENLIIFSDDENDI